MAPFVNVLIDRNEIHPRHLEGNPGSWRKNATSEAFVIESWSQGFMVGALLIMACITISNMKARITLHKLILLELFLAMSHGTFCFMNFDGYGWYLSSTAALLYSSWLVHNLVAWRKIRPFLTKTGSRIFIGTMCLTIPPILFQIVNNFLFFNNISDRYVKVRPFEVLMRDPWWIFACVRFFFIIKTRYTGSIRKLINGHPRFAIMLLAMLFSIIFTVVDVLSSLIPKLSAVDGINPYWKIALVFKALTDTIILDDFKTCLDKLIRTKQADQGEIDRNHRRSIPPPPVPPKDTKLKQMAVKAATWNTAKSSPTLVTGPSPRVSPRAAMMRNADGFRAPQRTNSVHDAIGRIGTRLSPLPNMAQMRGDISPGERSPRSGGPHMIHVKMDLGLNRFVHSVVGRPPSSQKMESPLDPNWPPKSGGLRRGTSLLSNGALSSNPTSSISSSIPTLPERTPTWSDDIPTPRAI